VDATLTFLRRSTDVGTLIFANLVDFDMLYGHRNNPEGYARALEAVDARVPELLVEMRPGDLLFFTADHGNDPTTSSTDHSREYVPLLAVGALVRAGTDLGTRASFADLGATIADVLGLSTYRDDCGGAGASFARELLQYAP
jgi:phosphopentomutase